MTMMANIARDALTAAQRAEMFRRQMLVERDRLEVMHASLHIVPPEDHDDIEQALTLRLGASEMAALDGVTKGKVEDFLVARIDLDNDDEPIFVLAWSDLAASIAEDGAEEAAIARLTELGIDQSALREAMARKVVHQARIEAIREFREVLANPGAAYARVPIAGYEPATQYVPAPVSSVAPLAPAQAVVAGPWPTMTPSEAVLKFFEHNPRTGGKTGNSRKKGGDPWTSKTREQFKLPALLLEQVMGGRPLATITHDDLVQLDGCFDKLHGPSFRKSPKHRDMTIWEIVDETEAKVVEGEKAAAQAEKRKGSSSKSEVVKRITREELGLGINTTNRHWGFLRQLTDWFHGHHPLAKLDYGAFIANDTRNQRDLRPGYTVDQGRMLFSLPPWTGAKSYARRTLPGQLMVHDAWYFVPMIAWYTGMRLDEISSLELDEIEFEDGHWQIQVKWNSLRRLKTHNSTRVMPVPSELLRLGFAEYVKALRAAGEDLLFPELLPESGIGTLGDAFYKTRWTHIAKKLPFLVRGQANHSFRHTAIDAMKAAGIPPEVRADFGGHVMSSETEGRYSKAHMALLRNAAETIPKVTADLDPFPVNLLPVRRRTSRKARNKKTLNVTCGNGS